METLHKKKNVNALSHEEVQQEKYTIWSTPTITNFTLAPTHARLVAEGDSWFDYPAGLDILDFLKRDFDYEILRVAEAGDSLENMVYGTEYRSNYIRQTPEIESTLTAIRNFQPRVFLFSGGGNDIAGTELEAFLNHKDTGLPLIRQEYVEYIFSVVAKKAYQQLINRVTQIKSDIQIISHGYGHSIPDGSSVQLMGIRFAGPWLRPALTKKNITEAQEARSVITTLVDRFNQMLKELSDENANFHYLDLRKDISDDDWTNELHLKNAAYRRVAQRFHEQIQLLQPLASNSGSRG